MNSRTRSWNSLQRSVNSKSISAPSKVGRPPGYETPGRRLAALPVNRPSPPRRGGSTRGELGAVRAAKPRHRPAQRQPEDRGDHQGDDQRHVDGGDQQVDLDLLQVEQEEEQQEDGADDQEPALDAAARFHLGRASSLAVVVAAHPSSLALAAANSSSVSSPERCRALSRSSPSSSAASGPTAVAGSRRPGRLERSEWPRLPRSPSGNSRSVCRRSSSRPTAKRTAKTRMPSGLWKAAIGAQAIRTRKTTSPASQARPRCSRT